MRIARGLSLEQKLEFYSMPEPNSGCLLWTAAIDSWGYGYFKHLGKMLRAHRASWLVRRGPIPEGLLVCHKCDIPSCLNPSHLFLGTGSENSRDMARKNRHGLPKLTPAQALAIRADRRAQHVIAAEYGVHPSLISRIHSNETWVSV